MGLIIHCLDCTYQFSWIQKRLGEQQQQAQPNATGNDPVSTTETPTSSTSRRAKRRYNSILSLQRIRTLPPVVGAPLTAEEEQDLEEEEDSGDGSKTEGRKVDIVKYSEESSGTTNEETKRNVPWFHPCGAGSK